MMMHDIAPRCDLRAACELGEGPIWRAKEGALWFVDIKLNQIHRWRPATGEHRTWAAPDAPGFIAPTQDGRWIAGLRTGLHWFDPANGAYRLLATVEDPALGNRLNDGFADACGRLWFGSMDDREAEPSGALYRFDARGLARMDGGYRITNGPAVSPDGKVFYHTDTLGRVIYAYDLLPEGSIGDRRPFVRIEDGAGWPDGSVVDAEGCVWTCLFGGWAARRYSPKGELLQTVRFPVANVTKIAFGGADLKRAYATTARKDVATAELAEQPLAGGVFSFPLVVPGLPQNELQIS